MNKRIDRVVSELIRRDLTHVVLAPGASFQYVTGIHAHQSERLTLVGIGRDGKVSLIVPLLEADSYADHPDWAVYTYKDEEGYQGARDAFVRFLHINESSRIGVERDQLRLFEADALGQYYSCFISAQDLVMSLRLIKDEDEIGAILRATSIVDQALQEMLPTLKVGMAEVEIAAELEYRMRRLGSAGVPFATIVCAGERAALPHGEPSIKKVQAGELVVLDYGAIVDGYKADTTRTIAFGDPGKEARYVYETVQKAQQEAIVVIRPGLLASAVDAVARDIITQAGFGEFFTHRTGHGLGLGVHEFPSIMKGNDLLLEPGMVFTVEPGIYLPKKLGVRIEDDVVVTGDGVRILTQFPKDLLIVQ